MKCKCLLLVAAILFAACGGDSSSGPAPENTPNSSAVTQLSSSDGGKSSAVSSSSATVGKESSSSAKVTTARSSSAVSSSSAVNGSTPANYDAATNTVTDERDGKKYKTVTIGSQTWFAQNLNYAIDGSVCPEGDSRNCDRYGRLYTWEVAQNVCPEGWMLPDSLDLA